MASRRRTPVAEAGAAEGQGDAARPIRLVGIAHGLRDHVLDEATDRKDGILRDVPDPGSAPQRARAAVRGVETGQDPQQRGLARSVGADQTHAVALEEPEGERLEERPGPVGLADPGTAQQERTRHRYFFCLGFFIS
jgi:hypothetical protein